MNAREQALADQNPTFADLCDRVRVARLAHLRTSEALNLALERVKVLALELGHRLSDLNDATDTLNDLIDRETKVEE